MAIKYHLYLIGRRCCNAVEGLRIWKGVRGRWDLGSWFRPQLYFTCTRNKCRTKESTNLANNKRGVAAATVVWRPCCRWLSQRMCCWRCCRHYSWLPRSRRELLSRRSRRRLLPFAEGRCCCCHWERLLSGGPALPPKARRPCRGRFLWLRRCQLSGRNRRQTPSRPRAICRSSP